MTPAPTSTPAAAMAPEQKPVEKPVEKAAETQAEIDQRRREQFEEYKKLALEYSEKAAELAKVYGGQGLELAKEHGGRAAEWLKAEHALSEYHPAAEQWHPECARQRPGWHFALAGFGALFFLLNFGHLWPLFLLFGGIGYALFVLLSAEDKQKIKAFVLEKTWSLPENPYLNLTLPCSAWVGVVMLLCTVFGAGIVGYIAIGYGGFAAYTRQEELKAWYAALPSLDEIKKELSKPTGKGKKVKADKKRR